MSQNVATICAHNAEAQPLVPGRPVPCRKCGCMIEPEQVNAENKTTPGAIRAGYPGEPNA
jgi:hypothetical protein